MGALFGGGAASSPKESPDTLHSAQRLKVVDIICEGPIANDVSLQNILLDGTPIQNENGDFNFKGVDVAYLPGHHDQGTLKNFEQVSKVHGVGVEVKKEQAVTRMITDPLVDSVRVIINLSALSEQGSKGSVSGSSVELMIKAGDKEYPVCIEGKTSQAYNHDVLIENLPEVPFAITVSRITPDDKTKKINNRTYWSAYVENTNTKFTYPDTVVVGLSIDSNQFGGKVPTRTYITDWQMVQVPANYNPKTREYTGIWDGTFKLDWTDNPAWLMYDLITNKRYGMGERVGSNSCDKWSLYEIAKYCDQIVPDGFGGEEPRFTCNTYIAEQRDAKALLDDMASCFRGVPIWNGTHVTFAIDCAKDPVTMFTNSNVVDGLFEYTSTPLKTIFTAAHVQYLDKNNGYKQTTEYVADDEAIARYGLNVKQFKAFGCTSRGQAARAGRWMIETSIRERQTVSFKTGMQGICLLPWDIIQIADNDYAGDQLHARVKSVEGVTVTADREFNSDVKGANFHYLTSEGMKRLAIEAVDGKTLTLSAEPVGVETLSIFSVSKLDIKPRLFRVVNAKEEGEGVYTISAIQHDSNKEAVVDQGMTFKPEAKATLHKPILHSEVTAKKGNAMVVAWDSVNADEYIIKLYRNEVLYLEKTQSDPQVKFKKLPNGKYRSEVRARNNNGEISKPVIQEWEIGYSISGLISSEELFSIKLEWANPTSVLEDACVEVWHSKVNRQSAAKLVTTLPLPTHTYSHTNVKLSEIHYFWLRIKDVQGNVGDFAYISGQCTADTSAIVDSIQGKVTKSALAQSLIESLQNDIDVGVLAGAKEQEKKMLEKARELGTKIASVEHLATSQAQKIEDVSASANGWVSALEAEKTARISGDEAESAARRSLANQVSNNTSGITELSKTVTNERVSTAEKIESLSSEVKSVKAGGKNLLLNGQFADQSHWDFSASRRVHVNDAYTNDVDVGINIWNKCKATQTLNLPAGEYTLSVKFRSYHKDTDSIKLYINKESKEFTMTGSEYYLCVLTVSSSTPITSVAIEALPGSDVMVAQAKLETGSKATEWAPAPVDAGRVASATSASLDKLSKTVADNKSATSKEVSALGAKVDTNKSSIETLSQVVSTTNEATANKITSLTAQVESQPSVAVCFTTVEDFKKDWNIRTGGTNLSTSSYPSLVVGGTGKNGYIWTAMKRRFPMMSRWIYRITYRVDLSQSGGRSYFGVEGFDKNGNLCNNNGKDSWSSQHYAKHTTERAGWHDVVIHLVGDRVSDHTSLPNVKVIRHDVKAIAPLFIFGYSNEVGTAKLASIKVELLTEESLKASSAYTIKTQAIAGGKKAIAGISMGAMADEQTAESSVIVLADKFQVATQDGNSVKPVFTTVNNGVAINGDLIAKGTISADHLRAGGTIRGARLEGVTGVFDGQLSAHTLLSSGVPLYLKKKIKKGELIVEGLVYKIKGNLHVEGEQNWASCFVALEPKWRTQLMIDLGPIKGSFIVKLMTSLDGEDKISGLMRNYFWEESFLYNNTDSNLFACPAPFRASVAEKIFFDFGDAILADEHSYIQSELGDYLISKDGKRSQNKYIVTRQNNLLSDDAKAIKQAIYEGKELDFVVSITPLDYGQKIINFI
ncbi:MAG: phage tail protein [Gammaproteobacteria bacterium]|nr:phage tail protein [Gammaproteobacteria bacterium]